jgi:hypothetical protein
MCILWYLRNIKVIPTFLSFLKLSGGVNLTLILVSCFSIKKQVVRMGLSPAWFPISSQRIGGEPEIIAKGGLHKPTFFCIIYTMQ